jgi:hypothetical protein
MVEAKMVGCPTQELVKRVTPVVIMQVWGVTTSVQRLESRL